MHKKIYYFIKFFIFTIYYIADMLLSVICYVVIEAAEMSKDRILTYDKLKANEVRCEVCDEFYNPFNQVGLCPHEIFNNWIGIDVAAKNGDKTVIQVGNKVTGDMVGGDLIKNDKHIN